MGRIAAILLILGALGGATALSLTAVGVPTAAALAAPSVRVGSVARTYHRSSSRRTGGGVYVGGGSRSRSRYSGGGGYGGYGK